MAMTFAQMANLATLSPLSKAVIYSVLSPSPLLQKIPFDDVGDLQTLVMEATGFPVPSHRAINPTAITVVNAEFSQRTEQLKIMSDQIRIDRQLLNNKSSHVNPRTAAIEQYTKAVAYETVRSYVRGSPAVNPDEPAGLEYRFTIDPRISDGTAAPATQLQVVDAGVDAQAMDVTVAAEQEKMINDTHNALSLVDGGNAEIMLLNRQTWLNYGSVTRSQRIFRTDKDMFGRSVMTFGDGGPALIDAGYTPAGAFDRSVQIIPNDGAAGSTNDIITDACFFIKFASNMHGGLQKMAPETIDLNTDAGSFPNITYAFEWVYGFHLTNPFSVVLGRRWS